jgi:type II secretory pathway pseudopilin PulG
VDFVHHIPYNLKISGSRLSVPSHSAPPPQSPHCGANQRRRREGGYILITLMLFVSLLAIAAVAVLPEITQQVQRDREEELIHRGVQYSRAIKHYVKKFNRYPTKIEDLENTSNYRSLRKRYKDPITGTDFKLLHFGEVQMIGGGAGIAGALSPNQMNAAGRGPAGALGGPALGANLGGAGLNNALNSPAGQQLLGQAQAIAGQANAAVAAAGAQGGEIDAEQQQQQFDNQQVQSKPGVTDQHDDNDSGSATTQVFGGGPIVGVASTSKKKSIREFNKKDHYNKWQFIYDPATDKGGLLTTPNQPPLQGASPMQPGANGQPGVPGAQQGGIAGGTGGQPGGFGGQGFGNATGQPPQPPTMPPDQQQQ